MGGRAIGELEIWLLPGSDGSQGIATEPSLPLVGTLGRACRVFVGAAVPPRCAIKKARRIFLAGLLMLTSGFRR